MRTRCSPVNDERLPQKEYDHISISDNGIGFDPRYKEQIFEVFQRLYGKDEYPGTGIGLAIVKKIVKNHSGIITATGELDKGATFDIYIPAP
jgi:signal transduction histidine kinase